ncbi:MAG: 2-C-methyl-D-erythritol 4-phosphate cytidylyltransferase [Armatimonadetes bacterium]|nr:2-C-methyl-D-erythritol 4-phosphate cytidylyltransferase [Armatimonadota bacterium]MCX7969136.1 2-C-methyl-D-erythritol 4-phosphate cytidylyltransferase [Armatimonadota bacterium]MDW8144121.1 2-C-methyl-D-erythritol 4-phosphate cytidylyltransferase [Armatimonadota bacterium]
MTTSIIPAAGKGTRLGSNLPKALVPIAGKPMITWTIAAFEQTPVVNAIVLVAPDDSLEEFERLRTENKWQKVFKIIPGGTDRQQSVWKGLQAMPSETEWVIVHDAARPLVKPSLIVSVWEAAQEIGTAAIAALPCSDTVKRTLDGVLIAETLDREQIWLAQTPQVFAADLLKEAHEQAIKDGCSATDDAALVERLGVPIRLVMGDPTNIKITHSVDLILVEALISGKF